jgi:hypothetical protein
MSTIVIETHCSNDIHDEEIRKRMKRHQGDDFDLYLLERKLGGHNVHISCDFLFDVEIECPESGFTGEIPYPDLKVIRGSRCPKCGEDTIPDAFRAVRDYQKMWWM